MADHPPVSRAKLSVSERCRRGCGNSDLVRATAVAKSESESGARFLAQICRVGLDHNWCCRIARFRDGYFRRTFAGIAAAIGFTGIGVAQRIAWRERKSLGRALAEDHGDISGRIFRRYSGVRRIGGPGFAKG